MTAAPGPRVSPAFAGVASVALLAAVLAACSGPGPRPSPPPAPSARTQPRAAPPPAVPRPGGYYQDDGPGENPPADLDAIPDATPRPEPLHARANRPYIVFDRQYEPMTQLGPFRERGVASWYGRKFHGQRTSSGEAYDMYAMTAAHPTLPIPSYARVTSLRTGRSVVVRVNDRGPFLNGRVIDLSYTAAAKLGYAAAGSAEVDVELVTRFDRPEPPVMVALAGDPGVGGVSPIPPASPAPQASDAPQRLELETVIAPAAPPAAPAPADAPAPTPPKSPAGAIRSGATASGIPASSGGTAQPAAALPAAPPPRGVLYLQLGAFSSRENAQAARGRLARELDWLADRIVVRAEGGLFKVQAGPYTQRADALAAAERIREATGFRPFPVGR